MQYLGVVEVQGRLAEDTEGDAAGQVCTCRRSGRKRRESDNSKLMGPTPIENVNHGLTIPIQRHLLCTRIIEKLASERNNLVGDGA